MKQILLHIIYLVVVFGGGFVTSFLVDAPTKRAVAKLRVLVAREEAEFIRLRSKGYEGLRGLDNTFIGGYQKLLNNFKDHIKRLEGK